ncbi:MAG: biotin transporter BioY [Bacillota bacterium]|uniref:Biotin transporter n=1 Tax=Virgibacillus salarius TaxID=447199 RepID=A0A941DX14_9BACI|nr:MULTISPECIES: biotin transporter BioY [Bacillaceae]NAZ09966.1 biotin transporter BioY [Agaribacter marinus]MBR7797256.1 biotin transporter BioY [Virgibacillus salarius]MCC2251610.1 biotin transporter BioY [Virgibacillus sp. AGTR]MDY7045907.1 biotin transporter BioY [Virgibacillus sp. M23]QRZ19620.1 biotin transporter BioY [Virgibacillus sp. AGTR]
MHQQSRRLRIILNCAIFAALTAILAQVEIPLPLIPISGQTLAVGITATILGSRQGALAMICYALLGACGLPVFAGFTQGIQVLAGPTGGYIFGFILAAYITGWVLEKTKFNLAYAVLANTIGMLITLICGTIQIKYLLAFDWTTAFLTGALPFIVVGMIKALLASWIGIIVRRRLIQAKLILANKQSAA